MKHTPLYDRHVRDASLVINLKGFARATHYRGHVAEHRATREGVSLCDVSHMGEIEFEGPDALALVQKLITNDAGVLAVNQALYSVMCNAEGVILDDLVCFRLAADRFVWVVNVTKTDEDFQWVLRHAAGMKVKVTNVSAETALLALQGPKSREALQRITKADLSALRYYWLVQTTIHTARADAPCIVSRTGYTGEHGYEIMLSRELAPWVWDELLMAGRPLGIEAHGVAARESLRTEAGYLLNGNDMDRHTNPFEAGLGWVVKLTKDFVGSEALAQIKKTGVRRQMVGLELDGRHTVRHGYRIYAAGREIGHVTSGPLSASLAGRNLGLGYVAATHAAPGTEIEVDVRGRRCKGRVVAAPFCARRVKHEPAINTHSPYALRFSDGHVWAKNDGARKDIVTLGLTDYGQRSLGDILCVDLPRVGDPISAGTAAAWVDTYRKAFDIVSPLNGEVVEVNEALVQQPLLINGYPYAERGLFKLRLNTTREYEALMDFAQYALLLRRLAHYDEWSKERRMT